MFKALKGKAAAALDAAAATTSGGGGDTKELEAKMASMVSLELFLLWSWCFVLFL